ncbi:prepilin peptidase [Psychrobacter sp. FDAARGOS_221]|uniref:prepilin peptidase n=1 Tax=Psychrobacter sp. FDAARGOS_221 TaxID=1975705 RepID=UPI000BB55F3E|nr:A24 family peptidase [Psychrobacter sp. FDAARGOS_221]PNK60591.1 prepilin peptidase [Psychrobacter sp. FDAARGOS_221]
MHLWQLLQHHHPMALILFGLIGLCVGSFLNVVVYRTPLMMWQQWLISSVQLLQSQSDIPSSLIEPIAKIVQPSPALSLSTPASHCPQCQSAVNWYHNIPIISWLALKGRCAYCQAPISIRYPLVEISCALLSMLVIHLLGVSVTSMAALLFVWILLALALIDFDSQFLPDKLTFPLAGLGLAVNSQGWFVTPSESIWGLLIGYLSLWSVVQLFYLFTKKQGMGQGDFKLLAALGAWLGAWMLPFIILLSSLLGSIIGIILLRKYGESRPFAFGPYLAIAGILALLYGNPLL